MSFSSIIKQIENDRNICAGDDPRRLEHFGFKVYSQSDEDGIIEEIFQRIGVKSKIFVDFGAERGEENNSRYLLEKGWTGLWIEASPDYAKYLRSFHEEAIREGRLKFIEAAVTAENINQLISSAGITGEIDFLSVDIDGNDYHVYNAISVIQPRVVCLEHNHCYPPPEEWVMPYDPHYRWTAGSRYYGASIASFEKLARSKGMILVGCGLYSPNGFYVRENLVNDSFSGPFNCERFFNPLDYQKIVSFPRKELKQAKEIKVPQTQKIVEEDYKTKWIETEKQLQEAKEEIAAMKTSKFWKLRSLWFKVKRTLGLATE